MPRRGVVADPRTAAAAPSARLAALSARSAAASAAVSASRAPRAASRAPCPCSRPILPLIHCPTALAKRRIVPMPSLPILSLPFPSLPFRSHLASRMGRCGIGARVGASAMIVQGANGTDRLCADCGAYPPRISGGELPSIYSVCILRFSLDAYVVRVYLVCVRGMVPA